VCVCVRAHTHSWSSHGSHNRMSGCQILLELELQSAPGSCELTYMVAVGTKLRSSARTVSTLFFFFFFFFYEHWLVFCLCVCLCKGVNYIRTGVTDHCEKYHVGAGHWTWILWKSSHVSSPIVSTVLFYFVFVFFKIGFLCIAALIVLQLAL
jgi:hypothetical protein